MTCKVCIVLVLLTFPFYDSSGQDIGVPLTSTSQLKSLEIAFPIDSIRLVYSVTPDSSSLQIKPHEVFKEQRNKGMITVEDFVEYLLSELHDSGYPHAEIRLLSVKTLGEVETESNLKSQSGNRGWGLIEVVDSEKAKRFDFLITPLSVSSKKAIQFSGQYRLSDPYLWNYLRPILCNRQGSRQDCSEEPLNEESIQQIVRRLNLLPSVSSVSFEKWSIAEMKDLDPETISEVEAINDSEDLPIAIAEFRIQETNQNRFNGLLGLANEQGSSTLIGQLSLDLPALTDNGLGLLASLSRYQENQSEASVQITKQMLSIYPVNVNLKAEYFQQDSLFLESDLRAQFTWNAWSRWSVGARVRFRNVRSGISSDRFVVKERSLVFTGYQLQYQPHGVLDFRDFYEPLSGYSLTVSLDHTLGREKQIMVDGIVRSALPILDRTWVIHADARTQFVHEKELSTSELIPIGGAKDFPGLNPAQIRIKSRVQSDLQVRWYATQNFMFHLFSSNGWISVLDRVRSEDDFSSTNSQKSTAFSYRRIDKQMGIHTAGVGFAVETRSGWLDLSTSWSNIDQFSQAQIQVRFTPN